MKTIVTIVLILMVITVFPGGLTVANELRLNPSGSNPVATIDIQDIVVTLTSCKEVYQTNEYVTLTATFPKHGTAFGGLWSCGLPMEPVLQDGIYTASTTFQWALGKGFYTCSCNVIMTDAEGLVVYTGQGAHPIKVIEVHGIEVDVRACQETYQIGEQLTLTATFPKYGETLEGFWACGTPMDFVLQDDIYTATIAFDWVFGPGPFTVGCNVIMTDEGGLLVYQGQGACPVIIEKEDKI